MKYIYIIYSAQTFHIWPIQQTIDLSGMAADYLDRTILFMYTVCTVVTVKYDIASNQVQRETIKYFL